MKLTPPEWLDDAAKEYFNETVAALGKHAVATDESLIADYAQAVADVVTLTQRVRFEGETLISDKGNSYTNPINVVLMSRRKDVERLRKDLGFTPRQRGVVLKETKKSGLSAAMETT